MERAVIDRVEGELAVLLVGDDERELVVPLGDLPPGSGPGVWLRVTLEDGRLIQAEVDSQTTRVRQWRIQEKIARLLNQNKCRPP